MAQRYRGKIIIWKADKGFGFIRPDGSSNDVFFHISNLAHRPKSITPDTPVVYTLTHDDQHRPQAVNVYLDNAPLAPIMGSLLVGGAFFLGLGALIVNYGLSPWIFVAYLVVSAITFFVYAEDKRRAGQGFYRISEAHLHLLELLGGWPGALVAQQYFRHKTRKASYQAIYWLLVLFNLGVLALYVYTTLAW